MPATKKKATPPAPPKIVETKRLSTSRAIGSPSYNVVVSRNPGGRKFKVTTGCNSISFNTKELDLVIALLTQAKEDV
jgi:hypothetical protein